MKNKVISISVSYVVVDNICILVSLMGNIHTYWEIKTFLPFTVSAYQNKATFKQGAGTLDEWQYSQTLSMYPTTFMTIKRL